VDFWNSLSPAHHLWLKVLFACEFQTLALVTVWSAWPRAYSCSVPHDNRTVAHRFYSVESTDILPFLLGAQD